ncbi:PadR family transcriptional regulator [Virgibacillus dakarensis]|uniref:PadR family transcriptional regulator n=1 Tax=Lentibacillus populi TaxID=1827502 RepID=A0A9W5X713_9BACI|nr:MULTISPECIES: PadR family transcriptional regulator [Bacillaceae]MBT2218341.1 PadR family transcriptional regulator [Virgibacillus dakarensis]MTW85661.1 PadR family transcriptional regulator [Virgibacillus dakarensis]GGB55727.1 PadR family transcriptional regulator [Lentibacillus populi]
MDREIMKGSIDILLLNLLSEKDMYGYEMVKVLKDKSEQLYSMSEGTLYPALKRMEKKNWVCSYWSETENGRRKYYKLTDDGSAILEKKLKEWNSIHNLITKTSGNLS